MQTLWRRLAAPLATTALALATLLGTGGCSSGSGGAVENFGNAGPAPTGTLEVHLEDPTHHFTPGSVNQTLQFVGRDDAGLITYGPLTLPFSTFQILEKVPVQTTHIEATDPDDPTVAGESPAYVDAGGISYVTDLILLPVRDGVAVSGKGEVGAAAAQAVGAGFIQTSLSPVGNRNANATMAGAKAVSATTSLPFPYRTNSWLTPLLMADNTRKAFLGASNYQNNTPQTIYQKPVYPHPWAVLYNMNPNVAGRTGLLFSPERVRTGVSTKIPNPRNNGVIADGYLDLFSTFDVATLQVDPGFKPYAAKVHRMGDYDAEFILRGLDDRDFDKTGLPKDAALKFAVVRGLPFLYFRAISIPKVTLNNFYAGLNTNTTGTLTVGGAQIGYNVITGPYPNNQTLTSVLFWPAASASYTPTTIIDSTLTFNNPAVNNYFVIASLPNATFADQATLQKLAEAAFNYPTDSTVVYAHDQATQTSTATYTLSTVNVLGLNVNRVFQGLMPHHYLSDVATNNAAVLQGNPPILQNGAAANMEFMTAKGKLRIYEAASFTCAYPYVGILPWYPALDAGDAAGRAELANWIQVFKDAKSGSNPPYTAMADGVGQDIYNVAKFLGRNVLAAASIRATAGDTALADTIQTQTRAAIELYFRQTPTLIQPVNQGQAPYYTYYDPLVATLNMYPATAAASSTPGAQGGNTDMPSDTNAAPYDGFGLLSRANDHHFTYGYFIYAASEIALRDTAWANDWKPAINQLIFDVANDPAINTNPTFKFPKYRNWDAYMNHGMATGFSWGDDTGNNEESISEHINFWAAVIQWAAATNQPALLEQAQAHYSAAVHSSWVYWFDPTDRYADILATVAPGQNRNWPGKGSVRQFDSQSLWSNFFYNHPIAQRGITIFPLTPAGFYHVMNPAATTQMLADIDAFIAVTNPGRNIDPLHPDGLADWKDVKNQWLSAMNFYSCFAKYAALVDPANALTRYYPAPSNNNVVNGIVPWDKLTDPGDSGIAVYSLTRWLQTHGKPNPWVRATNTPFFMVFDDTTNNKRTYVGFNATGSALTLNFSNGETLTNVPARSMATKEVSPIP